MILVGVANTIAAISIIVSLLRSPNIKYLTTEVLWIISINYQAVIHSLMHLHSVYYLGQGESKCFNIARIVCPTQHRTQLGSDKAIDWIPPITPHIATEEDLLSNT